MGGETIRQPSVKRQCDVMSDRVVLPFEHVAADHTTQL